MHGIEWKLKQDKTDALIQTSPCEPYTINTLTSIHTYFDLPLFLRSCCLHLPHNHFLCHHIHRRVYCSQHQIPWIFPYYDLLYSSSSLLIAMHTYFIYGLLHPLSHDQGYITLHCDAAYRPHFLSYHSMLLFLYFIFLYIVHCILYVHTYNP